jgi:hypothetical protein
MMAQPKLFISYSWSNPEHEQWVIDLATQLVESDVHVILDKWDLKEGHDAYAFMERMVTDPEIKKVVIVCDEKYVAKADGRAGGVGTETQILSREVYENQSQDKFVVVVSERDADGKPYLPTYYKSRIYIDLSTADRYSESFERLLRWIYDKPLYVRPAFGSKPAFLKDGEAVSLSTTALFNRSIDAIKNHKPHAFGALEEYLGTFATNLERFRLVRGKGEFDDSVVESITEFLPYRNEVIQLLVTVAQYSPGLKAVHAFHRFFEQILPYMSRPRGVSSWTETDFDNFQFIVHELFLYAIAVFLKYERFEDANYLLQNQYYVAGNSEYGKNVMVGFEAFQAHVASLKTRSHRLSLGRASLHADLLRERAQGSGLDFGCIMQADFIAFMRNELESTANSSRWWPQSLVLLGHTNAPFQVFARSSSKAYFDQSKVLLSITSPSDLDSVLAEFRDNTRRLPRWDYHSFNPSVLLGRELLATRP